MIAKTLSILAATASLAAFGAARAQTYNGGDYGDYAPAVGEVTVIAPGPYAAGRQVKAVPVYFADLDLNSPEGGYTLLRRIRSAATQACDPVADFKTDLRDVADFQHCVRRAVDRAVDEVGAPSVQDAYYDLGVGTADLPGG